MEELRGKRRRSRKEMRERGVEKVRGERRKTRDGTEGLRGFEEKRGGSEGWKRWRGGGSTITRLKLSVC